MSILLIGGNGFLGLSCAKKLAESHTVVIIDRTVTQVVGCVCHKIDIADSDKVVEVIQTHGITVVVHFASSLLPSSGFDKYEYETENVYLPTLKVMEYCAGAGVKFCFLSSGGAIYGERSENVNEDAEPRPISLYGLSKLNYENALKFYNNTKNLSYMILRPSNPYGYGQNLYGRQGLIAITIGKIIKGEAIDIWGDGSAVKDYIHIDDFVLYATRLIELDRAWNGVYNIGSGMTYSVNEVMRMFEDNGIRLPGLNYIRKVSGDVGHMHLDCTKLRNTVPHECVGLREGIRLFWDQVAGGAANE